MSGSEADHVADKDFPAFARRSRTQYQAALLGWLKEQSKDQLIKRWRRSALRCSSAWCATT